MSRGDGTKKQVGRQLALLEATNSAKGGISEHVGCHCQDLWHLCSLSDGEASGPIMVGERKLATSPPGCSGGSLGVTCLPTQRLSWSSTFTFQHHLP